MGFIDMLLSPLKTAVSALNGFLWGDIILFNVGETNIGLSLLVLMLILTGIYYCVKTKMLSFRLFPEMIKIVLKSKAKDDKEAIIVSNTAFIESTLAQIYKEKDPLYGSWRGGPAYFMNRMEVVVEAKNNDPFESNVIEESDVIDKENKRYYSATRFVMKSYDMLKVA